ncbi:MAG TPA: DUF2784 domain-containing protein [Amycolatopsis sp.]|nr:DUF2784 domain-containing protein [Amycolatopsis sp.]
MYEAIAVAFVGLHFAALAYLLVGGFLAWRWPWLFLPHMLYTGWAVLTLFVPVLCPLTVGENWARHHAGQVVDDRPFMIRYVEGFLYPTGHINYLRAVFFVAIVASWIGFAHILWRRYSHHFTGATIVSPLSENLFPDHTSAEARGSTGPQR